MRKLFVTAAGCIALVASAAHGVGADVLKRDHVRLRVDYLELRSARAVDVIVLADGAEAWRKRLPAQTLHINLGPAVAAPGTSFQITVATPDGTVIGSATITDGGKDSSVSVKQGEVAKLIASTRSVSVWSIAEVAVATARSLDEEGRKALAAALVEFGRALVDASDGQVRIEQFTVRPGTGARNPAPGEIRVGGCEGECAVAVGTPDEPAALRVAAADADALVRAFEHAYLGVPATVRCWSRGDEPPTELEDRFDCRMHLSDTLAPLGVRLLPGNFPGPALASAPLVRFADEDSVDFDAGGEGDGLDDATIDEVISRHGEALSSCLRKTRLAKARIKFSVRGQDGRVTWVRVNDRTDGPAHDCVEAVMAKMRFPASKAARTVAVFEMSR